MKLLFLGLTLIIYLNIVSCISSRKIAGKYFSKFPIIGFFNTQIVLNKNSSFTYKWGGDAYSDTGAGHYKISGRNLTLIYEPIKIDTSKYEHYRKIGIVIMSDEPVKERYEPSHYKIRHNKLFVINPKREIIKKEQGIYNHKKYLFWGIKSYMKYRRYYLRRIN